MIDDATEGDISSKLTNFIRRVSTDKTQYQREIKRLEQDLLDLRAENDLLLQRISERKGLSSTEDTADILKENQAVRGSQKH